MIFSRETLVVVALFALGCSTSPGTEPPAAGGTTGATTGGSNSGAAAGTKATGGSAGAPGGAGSGSSGGTGGSVAASGGRAGVSAGGSSAGTSTGGVAAGGATSGSAGAGAVPATFAAVASIMAMDCGLPLCHGGAAPQQGLNFTDMATLRTTLTTRMVTECGNELLVAPGDPANSALLKLPTWKCTDSSGGPFVMPQGCTDDQCLSDSELATFQAWIAAGAPP